MTKVYHQVNSIIGSVISLRAEGAAYRELAEVTSRTGTLNLILYHTFLRLRNDKH